MTDDQIEIERLAGEVTLILRQGTTAERASLLRSIGALCGPDEQRRLEDWIADGFPEPTNYKL